MKLKQESYLKMSKIMKLKEQDILDYINGVSDIDGDFIDMPEVEEKISYVGKIQEVVFDCANAAYQNIKNEISQKDFAVKAMQFPFSSILFKMRQGLLTSQIFKNINWKKLKQMYDNSIFPEDNKLVILRGIPGSGKSTWLRSSGLLPYSICADTIRIMYSTPNPYISQDNDSRVWSTLYDMLETRMKNGEFTIIDGTHTTGKSLRRYKQLCNKYGFEMRVVDFKVSLEDALERNKNRPLHQFVPGDVIERMHNQLIQTFKNQEIIE